MLSVIQIIVSSSATVNVTVFYESLCPDSMRFIRKQLYPAYKSLQDYIEVELVPYGKASYSLKPWSASCQHGRNECYGNMLQACALARYPENDMQVKFVHCVMSEDNPPAAGAKCAESLNYSYDGVEDCAKGEEGKQLFAKHGDRTRSFREKLSFVPTVMFNGVYTEKDQKGALQNLKTVLCEKIGEPLPQECKSC